MNEDSRTGTTVAGVAGGVAGSIGAGAGARDALTEVLRRGAVDLLARAVRAQVAAWIDAHSHLAKHRAVISKSGH